MQVVEDGTIDTLDGNTMVGSVADGEIGDGYIVSLNQNSKMTTQHASKVKNDIIAIASLAALCDAAVHNMNVAAHLIYTRRYQDGGASRGI